MHTKPLHQKEAKGNFGNGLLSFIHFVNFYGLMELPPQEIVIPFCRGSVDILWDGMIAIQVKYKI